MLKLCSISFILCIIFLFICKPIYAQKNNNPISTSPKTIMVTDSPLLNTKNVPCTATTQQPQQPTLSLWQQIEQWFYNLFGIKHPNSTPVAQVPCPTSFNTVVINQGEATPSSSITPTETNTPTSIPTNTPIPPVITTTPTQAPAPVHSGTVKIMPLGDSITDGAVIPGGYRTYLWSLLHNDGDNFEFVGSLSGPGGNHEGHIGWTIPMLAGSVYGWVSTYQPDIILLNIGANDVDHGDSAANMTANLSRLLGSIYAADPNTYVILSTLIPTSHGDPNTWSSYNASIPGVAAAYGGHKIVVLNMSNGLGLSDLTDGLHPNASGYSKMAGMWYPVITTIYKEYAGTSGK